MLLLSFLITFLFSKKTNSKTEFGGFQIMNYTFFGKNNETQIIKKVRTI